MPTPDSTYLLASLWPQSNMSKTAWLNYGRAELGLKIRTQTYYRIIDETAALAEQLPIEWNRPLNAIPTGPDEIFGLSRAKFDGYLQHVHLLQFIPTTEGDYVASVLRWSIKTQELMSRQDAIQLAYTQARANQSTYGVEGSFLVPGFYIGTWQAERPPD